jgi:hypothetical protein
LGLDCQGLNPENIVLALLAQARDGELLEGEFVTEGGIQDIAATARADPLLDGFLACEGGVDETTEECLNLRCFVCCFHAVYYTLSRVEGQGFVVVFFAVVSLG